MTSQASTRPREVLVISGTQTKRVITHATFFLLMMFFSLTAIGQAYLGTITQQVNFREGPGKVYNVINSLKAGTQIFIVSLETDNDFYDDLIPQRTPF